MDIYGASSSSDSLPLKIKSLPLVKSQQEVEGQLRLEGLEATAAPKNFS